MCVRYVNDNLGMAVGRIFVERHFNERAKANVSVYNVRSCMLLAILATTSFLPARRYASAGNSDRNVSVCPSV